MAQASTTITFTAGQRSRNDGAFCGHVLLDLFGRYRGQRSPARFGLTSALREIPIVTTDEVLAEYLTFFAGAHENMRRKALINAHSILQNPGVRVVPQTHSSLLSGMELYEARPDKGYSLTDCVSMQTMRREGLTEALTNDRHFEQEGFGALFRD